MQFTDGPPTTDEASPILLPAAVALIVFAACMTIAQFAIPWDAIPTPTECHDVAVRGLLGRVKSIENICTVDRGAVTMVTALSAALSCGIAALSVVATLRALVGRSVRP